MPNVRWPIPAALFGLGPSFVGYAISFVSLGVYWIGHRAQFNYIKRADQNLSWLNILFFAFSARWCPFATESAEPLSRGVAHGGHLWGQPDPDRRLATTWIASTRHHRLVGPDLAPFVIRFATLRCLVAPAFYAIAIVVGLINPTFSLFFYGLVPLLYVLPVFQRSGAAQPGSAYPRVEEHSAAAHPTTQ